MSHIKAWFGIKNPNGSITAISGHGKHFNKDRIHGILSTCGGNVCKHLNNVMSNGDIAGMNHIENNGTVKCDYKLPSMFHSANINGWSPVVHFRDQDAYLKNIRIPAKDTHTTLYLADKDNMWHSSDDYANGFSPCNPVAVPEMTTIPDAHNEMVEDDASESNLNTDYALETDDEIDALPDNAFFNDENDEEVGEDEFEDNAETESETDEEDSQEDSSDIEDEEYDDLDASIDEVDFREAKSHPENMKLIYGNRIPAKLKKH